MFIICPSADELIWVGMGDLRFLQVNITFVVPPQDKLNPTSICFLVPKSYLSEVRSIVTLPKYYDAI